MSALPKGFLAESLEPHPAVADHRGDPEGARPEGRWPRCDRAGRGRARFRHPRQHQGSRHRRHQSAAKPNTPPSKAFPNCALPSPPSSSARTISTTSRRNLRGAGRQVHHLQRAAGDAEPRRRSDRARALLGELSRHRAARRRQARDRRDQARGRLPPNSRSPGSRDHAEDQVADLQPALQSDGRLLYARAVEGADRCADASIRRSGC